MFQVDYRVDRAVAVISFANPPVNGLSHAVRAGISAALDRARTDPAVRAIVLTGAGGIFSAGADITEFGTPASTVPLTQDASTSRTDDPALKDLRSQMVKKP